MYHSVVVVEMTANKYCMEEVVHWNRE